LDKTPRTSECTRLTEAVLHLHSGKPTLKAEKKEKRKIEREKKRQSFQDLKLLEW
jgi:hypothetical protein